MTPNSDARLLPAVLFFATLLLAVGFVGLVLVSPWVVTIGGDDSPLFVLCAEDNTVRQTLLASALGLVVTAFVFFKPSGLFGLKSTKNRSKYGPPGNFAGA